MRNRQAEIARGERNMSLIPRSEEHISSFGVLRVPVKRSYDPTPKREGWEPFFVNINLDDPIQKVVSYKRVQV
jgi:hypothetical protein